PGECDGLPGMTGAKGSALVRAHHGYRAPPPRQSWLAYSDVLQGAASGKDSRLTPKPGPRPSRLSNGPAGAPSTPGLRGGPAFAGTGNRERRARVPPEQGSHDRPLSRGPPGGHLADTEFEQCGSVFTCSAAGRGRIAR